MIKVNNISKKLGDKYILKDFSCELPKTGMVAIMGVSGSGKTTFIRILAGLEKPDEGTVEGLQNKKISVVFQEDRLFPHLTAFENVKIVSDDVTAENLLKKFGLWGDRNKLPSELSGGMCRRISLARGLAYGGDVLISDEPFKGLDEETKQIVFDVVKAYKDESLVILVTHDIRESEQADKIIKIEKKLTVCY